jgi:AcrR family transcriptional regulator
MHKPQARQRRRWGSTEAVLKAALHLTRKHGLANVSIEAIAARAGVGKQTIYRWWPSKGALTAQLQRVLALLQDPAHGPTIANLVAEAQHDPEVERAMANAITQPYRKLTLQRLREAQVQRKIKRNTDLDLLADAIFAPAWMRLLMGVAPLAGVDARRHIAQLFEGVRPSKSGTES